MILVVLKRNRALARRQNAAVLACHLKTSTFLCLDFSSWLVSARSMAAFNSCTSAAGGILFIAGQLILQTKSRVAGRANPQYELLRATKLAGASLALEGAFLAASLSE